MSRNAAHLLPLAIFPGADDYRGEVRSSLSGSVARIRVRGVLGSDDDVFSFFDAPGDVGSLRELEAAVRGADVDPEVDLIVLDLDGFGVNGSRVFETMGVIEAASTPTAAYVTGDAYSGIAMLSFVADHVAGHPGAHVGSVNWRIGFREKLEDDGLRFFSESGLKADESNGELTARVKKDIRGRLSRLADASKRFAKESRGLDDAKITEIFSGRTFVGQEAVDTGLLDGVYPTMDAFLASLDQEAQDMAKPESGALPPTDPPPGDDQAAALTPEDRTVLERVKLFFGASTPADPPVEPPKPPPAEDPRLTAALAAVDTLTAAVGTLTTRAEASDRAALTARIAACKGVPADLVEAQVDAVATMRSVGKTDEAEALVVKLEAAAGPARFSPGAFGELATDDVAVKGLKSKVPYRPARSTDPTAARGIAEVAEAAGGDTDAEMAALEALDAQQGGA